jgi:AcrR family transcriptional regulator
MRSRAKSKAQPIEKKRRKPAQARALDTVEVILQASAQILEREGRTAFNTNHVAERAGISIGTLYQYFDNKQAILLEIARREIERDRVSVSKAIVSASEGPPADPARIGLRALIASQRQQSKVRRAAFDALAAEGLSQFGSESAAAFQHVTQLIGMRRERLFSAGARQPSPMGLFIISRAVTAVIRAAIVEESPYLNSAEFEDELVHLVRAFFSQPPRSAA